VEIFFRPCLSIFVVLRCIFFFILVSVLVLYAIHSDDFGIFCTAKDSYLDHIGLSETLAVCLLMYLGVSFLCDSVCGFVLHRQILINLSFCCTRNGDFEFIKLNTYCIYQSILSELKRSGEYSRFGRKRDTIFSYMTLLRYNLTE